MRKVDEAKTEERRQQILKAAITCFQRSGFHGASISDICKEAGMQPSHLYYYFDSKEALITAVVEEDRRTSHIAYEWLRGRNNLLDVILIEHSGPDRGPIVLERPLTYECIAEGARNPQIREVLSRFMDTLYPMLVQVVGEAQERGEIDPALDTRTAAYFMQTVAVGQRVLEMCSNDYDRKFVGEFAKSILAAKGAQAAKPASKKPSQRKTVAARRR